MKLMNAQQAATLVMQTQLVPTLQARSAVRAVPVSLVMELRALMKTSVLCTRTTATWQLGAVLLLDRLPALAISATLVLA